MRDREHPCLCGCGEPTQGKYRQGHNVAVEIKPAGMTLERALEIATEVYDACGGTSWGRIRTRAVSGSSVVVS